MAAMPIYDIYGETFLNILLWNHLADETLKLAIQHWTLADFQVCSKDDHNVDLWPQRPTLVLYAFVWGKVLRLCLPKQNYWTDFIQIYIFGSKNSRAPICKRILKLLWLVMIWRRWMWSYIMAYGAVWRNITPGSVISSICNIMVYEYLVFYCTLYTLFNTYLYKFHFFAQCLIRNRLAIICCSSVIRYV